MNITVSKEINFPLGSTLQHTSFKVPSGPMWPRDEAIQALPVKGRRLDHPPPEAVLRPGLGRDREV